MPETPPLIYRRAKKLRKNMTPQEVKLWNGYLHRCPWKFRRQMPFGYYILDFCCIPLHVVIEIDGAHHYSREGRVHDGERDFFLEDYGFTVLRFTDAQIDHDFQNVVHQIKTTCEQIEPMYSNPGILQLEITETKEV